MIGKAGASGRHEKKAAGASDLLHGLDGGLPIEGMFEHLGGDHDVEGVRSECLDDLLSFQNLIDSLTGRHVRPKVARTLPLQEDRPRAAIDVQASDLEN